MSPSLAWVCKSSVGLQVKRESPAWTKSSEALQVLRGSTSLAWVYKASAREIDKHPSQTRGGDGQSMASNIVHMKAGGREIETRKYVVEE